MAARSAVMAVGHRSRRVRSAIIAKKEDGRTLGKRIEPQTLSLRSRTLTPSRLLPLILILLVLLPTPATSMLYLQSPVSTMVKSFPSEPAMFGRVFDGQITGRGSLFLPPADVDATLCGGVWGRGDDGGGELRTQEDQEEVPAVGEYGGGRNLNLRGGGQDTEEDEAAGTTGKVLGPPVHRRLLDLTSLSADEELRHRYLLASSSDETSTLRRRELHDKNTAAASASASSGHQASRFSSSEQPTPPRPIALLVERGGCTFHEKALNAMRLNQRLLREAVIISRDRKKDGDDDGNDEDDADGNNRRKDVFPEKGDAEGEEGGGEGGDDRERRQRRRRLQADDTEDSATTIDNAFDEDAIIEEGLETVQRDPTKTEVGTATPSDLLGSSGTSTSTSSNFELPTLRIDFIVIYNDEISSAGGRDNDLVLMDRPQGSSVDTDKVDVGLVFVSRRSGLEIRRTMDDVLANIYDDTVYDPMGGQPSDVPVQDGPMYHVSPYDLFPSTVAERNGWFLPVTVDSKSELNGYNGGWPRGSTPRDSFYWIRFALIALLIITPIARGCFVWHAAGGRVRFRRNDGGMIVGLHVVRPVGRWFDGWDDWEQNGEGGPGGRNRIRKMTQDEVMNLPEIEYTGVNNAENEEDERDERDNDDALDEVELGAAAATPATTPQAARDDDNVTDVTNDEDPAPATTTTCTSCSICIDEYEAGEKIRLLPRCGHAFHTDCIMPWLTERSGSCPLCKQNVMGSGTDGLEDEGEGEGSSNDNDDDDNNSIIDDNNERGMREEEENGEEEEQRARPQSTRSPVADDAVRSSNSRQTRRARRRNRRRNGLDV